MSNDIKLIQLNQYIRPTLQENKSKNWVLNGKNNEFYKYIIDRYNGSPTNAAIINCYTDLIYGKGMFSRNSRENLTNWVHFLTILKPKEIKKIISDFVLFGEASFQVVKTRGGDISSINHIPKDKVVPSLENEDGEIEGYWFSRDWTNINKNQPVFYPAFGTSKEAIEIFVIKPYKAGKNYFSDPHYLSALPYAEIEEELANFYINSIKKGLSAGYIINIPDGNSLTPEEKDAFETQIKNKLTGSPNAMSFVLSFNGREAEITITPFPVNENQHKQWEVLGNTAVEKILTGHRVTSASIIGLSAASGFSSVADEMDMAEKQLMKRVIEPMQNFILEAITEVVEAFGVQVDLGFKPLTEIKKEEDPKVELSKKKSADDLITLGEETLGDDWEVIDERRCDEMTLSEEQLNSILQFATAPRISNKKSDQDTSLFKVRYKYAGNPVGEREFCNKVIAADRFYRAEDLRGKKTWNAEFAPSGESSYDTFLFKGGTNCKHFWIRHIFLKKGNEQISTSEATKMILQLEPKDRADAKWEQNDKRVAQVAEKQNNYWSLQPNYRNSGVTPTKE